MLYQGIFPRNTRWRRANHPASVIAPSNAPVIAPSIARAIGMLMLMFVSAAHADEPVIKGAEIIGGDIREGGLILGKAGAGAAVIIDGKPMPVSAQGHFVIGFHRDSDDPIEIIIAPPENSPENSSDNRNMVSVVAPDQREYDIQRIDGLAQKMVTPPAAVTNRIVRDSKAVKAARAIMPKILDSSGGPNFFAGFDWPARGRISGVYGGQRILNGKPRQPHYGIDIAAPKGTPVRAPADGVITLVDDLYYSGWTIIMAHGLGVNSAFLHLDDIIVEAGTFVARGAVIGHIGSSGRSTGPHLDWRLDWQGRRLDAGLIAGPMGATPSAQ